MRVLTFLIWMHILFDHKCSGTEPSASTRIFVVTNSLKLDNCCICFHVQLNDGKKIG